VGSGLKRWRLPLLASAIGVVVLLLMVTAIRAATTYYYTLPQFRALGRAALGRFVQVNGVAAAVRWDSAAQRLAFELLPDPAVATSGAQPDPSRAAPLPVRFQGPEPDAFHAGIAVVVAGTLQPNGVFAASQVLVKCPSHYTAAPAGVSGAQWPTT
jgi:cytochrome c-type biogenesis protein CcmE